MSESAARTHTLPYSSIVGQAQLKLALELCYIEPRISGVLISGERGSGKSTTVRSFAKMATGELPVTLPINATEDRVVGGWDVGQLIKSKPVWKKGLLELANGRMLYVDEVNLLDDHIVNIILDVTASGILTVERDSQARKDVRVRFSLVGTMNPEEGTLRPQLLDRFGLMVDVQGLSLPEERQRVLTTVLNAGNDPRPADLRSDADALKRLDAARKALAKLKPDHTLLANCVALSQKFGADGHRGELTLALAACAYAAREKSGVVTNEHLGVVAPLALQHRRKAGGQREWLPWTASDDADVKGVLDSAKV